MLERLQYELRITGWWAFLTPVVVMLCLIPLTIIFANVHAEDLRIAQVLTASLEMLIPIAAGLLIANQVGYDFALELHLTFPSEYRFTAGIRTALITLWNAVIALLGSAFIYHLKYLRIPLVLHGMAVLPQFLNAQLTWLAPLGWFVTLGACFSLLIRSRTASSALLGGIWTLEAIFYGYFVQFDGLKPFFLFPTTLAPEVAFWLSNRLGLLGMALLLGLLAWFLLRNAEGLLRGASGGE